MPCNINPLTRSPDAVPGHSTYLPCPPPPGIRSAGSIPGSPLCSSDYLPEIMGSDTINSCGTGTPRFGDKGRNFPHNLFSTTSKPIGSISFTHRPDITVRVRKHGKPPSQYVFDYKYKLDCDTVGGEENSDAKPRKVDIDKMHAYRNATRD